MELDIATCETQIVTFAVQNADAGNQFAILMCLDRLRLRTIYVRGLMKTFSLIKLKLFFLMLTTSGSKNL